MSMEILCTLWSTPSPGLFENSVLIQITNCQLIILNILFTFFKKKKTLLTSEYNEVNKHRKIKYNKINNNNTYPLRVTDDNYINISRATYTQTPMLL
jgi:hypothetical protein